MLQCEIGARVVTCERRNFTGMDSCGTPKENRFLRDRQKLGCKVRMELSLYKQIKLISYSVTVTVSATKAAG